MAVYWIRKHHSYKAIYTGNTRAQSAGSIDEIGLSREAFGADAGRSPIAKTKLPIAVWLSSLSLATLRALSTDPRFTQGERARAQPIKSVSLSTSTSYSTMRLSLAFTPSCMSAMGWCPSRR